MENELEALIVQNKKIGEETNLNLETIIDQNDKNKIQPELEAIIHQNENTKKAVEESGSKVSESIKELKPVMDAAGFIANFMAAIKGDKGDKGDTPIKGKDYYTEKEVNEAKEEIKPVKGKDYFTEAETKEFKDEIQSRIRVPKDGYAPKKGTDYFTNSELEEIIKKCVSKIPTPKDGKDGKDGLDGDDAIIDYDAIIKEVVKKFPHIKKETKKTTEQIADELKGKLSFNDLKDLPLSFKTAARDYDFIELKDSPNSYKGQSGKVVKVKTDESGLEFGVSSSGVSTFIELTDVPNAYTGAGSKVVAVKSDASGLEFITATSSDEKVKYDSADPTAGYIADKIVAGTGISITEGTGGNENKLVITNDNPTAYSLPTAATSILGGVKVGTRLSIDGNGVLSADVQTGGTGDVVGPASVVDSNLASFDTTTGKLIKDSGSKTSDFATSGHNHTGVYAPVLGADDNYVTDAEKTSIGTIGAKRDLVYRVQSVTDAATVTPAGDTNDCVDITAIAQAFTIANPTGTPTNFQKLIIRIKDNGTARAITWGNIYVAGGVALPSTTILSKILTLGFIYNTANALNKWQLVASSQEV